VYNATGTATGHTVTGVSAATSGSSGDVVVTFSGAAAFTGAGSYVCVARDSTNATVATIPAYTSGTSVTFNLTGTNKGHTVTYSCTGN